MDMSVSEWMQAMIEAGRKKFDAQVEPDESAEQLRRQRNDLKTELERARERIQELETQLHHGEQAVIREFVEENPGATFEDITRHVIDTVPERVNRHLDELEGDALYVDDDGYYPESDG
ncbi:hypothetical protein KDQ40_01120 [Haloarcula marismortui ATCC 33800]|nr:hypothetical protein KDQ40_01120 [Haloarcula sinaiiensis ATCC 33800]